jgi:hypothetical protein
MKRRKYKVTQRERYFKGLNAKNSSDSFDDFLCDACRQYGYCRMSNLSKAEKKVKESKIKLKAETPSPAIADLCLV